MEIMKWEEREKKPKISFILFDWSVRESFHILDYFSGQNVPRDWFEVIWIEFYNRRPDQIRQKIYMVDKWIILEYPETIIYHKHLMYNIGVILANSFLICIPDSDAFFKPTLINSILVEFQKDPNIVLFLDECRNENIKHYPFCYPNFDEIQNSDECWNWPKDPEKVKADPLHMLNYGACMIVKKEDYIDAGGVDEDIGFLGYIAGPHELGWRLVNKGLKEVWHPTEYLYHCWHPGQGGDHEYKGEHDGYNMSELALEVKEKNLIKPRYENPGIKFLRENPAWIGDKRKILEIALPQITEEWLRLSPEKDLFIRGIKKRKYCDLYFQYMDRRKEMKVSDYIVRYLVEQGIEKVFLIYGAHNADLVDSIAKEPKLEYICVHHEQAGAMAIDGYYRASGKLSAMIATSGPGGTNLLTGICCGWYDSIPVLFITGQVSTAFARKNYNLRQVGFQENDIVYQVKGVTKYARKINHSKDIREDLDKAFYHMLEGRPGPVLLDIPTNIQKELINSIKLEKWEYSKTINSYPLKEIETVIEWLKESKRPALLLGGGIYLSKARKEVKELVHSLKIPAFLTYNALDLLPYDDPLYGGRVGTFGGEGRNFGIQNCDFLLCIGTRISGRITGGLINTFARGAKKIVVDIDNEELLHNPWRRDLNINCDAKVFINLLLRTCKERGLLNTSSLLERKKWTNVVTYWRHRYTPSTEYWPYEFVRNLSWVLDENEIIVFAAGGALVWCSQAWVTKEGQRIFTDNGHSSLGYTLPAAIGAAFAFDRKKRIIAICGDGDLMFNLQELQTIRNYNLPIKLFILNNQCYGIAKNYQDTYFNGDYVASGKGYSIPDFRKVSLAFGIPYVQLKEGKKELFYNLPESVTEIIEDPIIRTLLSRKGPCIIDVDMYDQHKYEPHLGWGLPIEMQLPLLPKEEFLENMMIEPIEGWEEIYKRYEE